MLRIILTTEQHTELQALRRDGTLSPVDRDRVEMLALSAAGWRVPAIAAHLGYHPETVRRLFHRFPDTGFAVVRHRPPGPGPDLARRAPAHPLRESPRAARQRAGGVDLVGTAALVVVGCGAAHPALGGPAAGPGRHPARVGRAGGGAGQRLAAPQPPRAGGAARPG